ncbi:prolyl 3-hydroxylase 1-like [Agrilus planipennis]|uniref:Prolyl 3-hydroxylase 1-like n=1 Tax=Agrilus planipennis TaxID=224129 RepID=A0A1W4XTB5_AGRPL|nr:prolyl 3-hydroxylase 1-like [Agrilus planipennis]
MPSSKQFLLMYIIFKFLLLNVTHCNDENQKEDSDSCEVLMQEGINSYLENNFKGCIEKLEKAVEKYNILSKQLQNCRLECAKEVEDSIPLYSLDVNNLRFFEKAVRNTLCIMKCKNEHPDLIEFNNIPVEIERKFHNKTPYEYLHLCYFQNKNYQKAASAAFTYLVTNPNDNTTRISLKHYLTLPDVVQNDIVNYEAKDYVAFYALGVDVYNKKDWVAAIAYMEESLSSYIQSEEECRAQCEGPFGHNGWYPDFMPAIANHFTFVLKCKRECKNTLNSLNGEKQDDFLPSHYDYLQYSYFKEKNYQATCAAVASYLLFFPDDQVMRSNMNYYLQLPEVEDYFFTPRPEAVSYIQRQIYEEKLMNFINKEFKKLK